MSYRFNSGLGGVTCDICYVLIDQDLSFKEYEEMWNKKGGDLCMKCQKKLKQHSNRRCNTSRKEN
jgi:hypothetical protein